jgi:hypothetical protein
LLNRYNIEYGKKAIPEKGKLQILDIILDIKERSKPILIILSGYCQKMGGCRSPGLLFGLATF